MKTSRRGLNRVLLNIYDGVLLETSEMLLVVDWIKYYSALLNRTASEVSAFVFSVFGLNIERCGVSLRIQSEYGKIRTRKTSNTDIFHPVSDISFFSSPPWFHFSAEFILKHLPLDYSMTTVPIIQVLEKSNVIITSTTSKSQQEKSRKNETHIFCTIIYGVQYTEILKHIASVS